MKDFFIYKGLIKNGYNAVLVGVDNLLQRDLEKKYLKFVLHFKFIIACFKAVLKSKKNDLIISWLDIMGVYVFLISKLLLRKRNILILNIMNPPGKNLYSRLRDKVYRYALKSDHCFATVNTHSLVKVYRDSFNLSNKIFYVLKDSVQFHEVIGTKTNNNGSYIFFGGSGGRDFELALSIAQNTPWAEFVFVIRKKHYIYKPPLPQNVKIYYDIPSTEFNDLILNSNLVLLPIKYDTPAGIIVLITAAFMSKCVIASNTLTLKEYIRHEYNGILVQHQNFENWLNYIKIALKDDEFRERLGTQLHKDILSMTSHENYMKNFFVILDDIIQKKEFLI